MSSIPDVPSLRDARAGSPHGDAGVARGMLREPCADAFHHGRGERLGGDALVDALTFHDLDGFLVLIFVGAVARRCNVAANGARALTPREPATHEACRAAACSGDCMSGVSRVARYVWIIW